MLRRGFLFLILIQLGLMDDDYLNLKLNHLQLTKTLGTYIYFSFLNIENQNIHNQIIDSNVETTTNQILNNAINDNNYKFIEIRSPLLFAEAKGVAGLGKAGGDGSAGSDKAGQQVPPEVYIALTYAGTAFLFTLSVPLILYGLNKLLNKIEDCFGCGPSSKKKRQQQQLENQQLALQQEQQQQTKKLQSQISIISKNTTNSNSSSNNNIINPNGSSTNGSTTINGHQLHQPILLNSPQQQALVAQQQNLTSTTTATAAITPIQQQNSRGTIQTTPQLPFEDELNYKTAFEQQHRNQGFQQQHPYIISSPYL